MQTAFDWSKRNVDALTEMWSGGRQITDISIALGVSRGAIAGKLSRLGLMRLEGRPQAPSRWTPARDDRVKSMRAAGHSMRQIADALDITHQAVCGRLDRLGLTNRRHHGVDGGLAKHIRAAQQPRFPRDNRPLIPDTTESLNVELLDLADNACHYPTGENEYRQLFCGHEQYESRPYCLHHWHLCYRPASRQGADLRDPWGGPK